MMEFIKFMFSDFFIFLGMLIILSSIGSGVLFMWNRMYRHWNIRKHGYPPPHCDADGDFKKEED